MGSETPSAVQLDDLRDMTEHGAQAEADRPNIQKLTLEFEHVWAGIARLEDVIDQLKTDLTEEVGTVKDHLRRAIRRAGESAA